jgi:di/tricarboxylate transporter
MEQTIVFITLGVSLILFIWNRLRYDVVAFFALITLVLFQIIPTEQAFSGLSHPAVITVAAVLIISKGLQFSGLVDVIVNWISKVSTRLWVQIILLSFIVAFASAFINNIGALAIIMPVALHLSRKYKFSPSIILMPLAFASILGGMMTLIGTPPNIIISTFREEAVGERFGMFDFAPVGIVLTVICLIYVTLIGWRFLPKRQSADASGNMFEIENYITEVAVSEDSMLVGTAFSDFKKTIKTDVEILGIIRNDIRIHAPSPWEEFRVNDVLIIEADTDQLKAFLKSSKTTLSEGKRLRDKAKGSEDIQTVEAIVLPNSPLLGYTVTDFRLRQQYLINVLAVGRQDRTISKRISLINIKAGDVLLLQGEGANIQDALKNLECLPLAKRDISIDRKDRIIGALAIFLGAIMLVVSGLLRVEIAFSLAAVVMVVTKILPIKEVYTSIDWPVIILLAAMIPVGVAFETSGGAETITGILLDYGSDQPVWLLAGLLMVTTILLSDVINNSATVVLMAPIAIQIANNLGHSPDPFLMIVAVAGSCAFLTPIGHHSSTLVMGPGGYKYSDYWKMGLPLTLAIIFIGVPLILYFWPV